MIFTGKRLFSKRLPFGLQKVAFCMPKDRLWESNMPPFEIVTTAFAEALVPHTCHVAPFTAVETLIFGENTANVVLICFYCSGIK